jgi:hypothetical protein
MMKALTVTLALLSIVIIHCQFRSPLQKSPHQRKVVLQPNCVNGSFRDFKQIEKLTNLPSHAEILINKQMDTEKQVTVQNVSFDIASDAVLLKISNGTVFRDWSGMKHSSIPGPNIPNSLHT